jgi:uncharacterized protein with von Willebrand factor type A (vWA) domain
MVTLFLNGMRPDHRLCDISRQVGQLGVIYLCIRNAVQIVYRLAVFTFPAETLALKLAKSECGAESAFALS